MPLKIMLANNDPYIRTLHDIKAIIKKIREGDKDWNDNIFHLLRYNYNQFPFHATHRRMLFTELKRARKC